MAGYSERIKRIDSARASVRDFFIYGFRTRQDITNRSGRSYDNDRRRLESWLGDAVRWSYGPGGKRVFVSMDAGLLARNPLHQAWKSKSFTDNDIILHFFLLDLLADGQAHDASWLTNQVCQRTGLLMDIQTVRAKLREYASMGLLDGQKNGRSLLYRRSSLEMEQLCATLPELWDAVAFFSEVAPLGTIGSYMLDRVQQEEPLIQLKHHFISGALDDDILMNALLAMSQGDWLDVVNLSQRRKERRSLYLKPLSVMISVTNGRRHLIAYDKGRKRLTSLRLDYIESAKLRERDEQEASIMPIPDSWGVSVSGGQADESFDMVVSIDVEHEAHVLQRLRRECWHCGRVEQVGEGHYRFSAQVSNSAEMMSWVKSYIGRIVRFTCSNQEVSALIEKDMREMAAMYGERP